MTPSQQQRKDLQDEARREQQADEKIRELEQEVERLRQGLLAAFYELSTQNAKPAKARRIMMDALNGGGEGT